MKSKLTTTNNHTFDTPFPPTEGINRIIQASKRVLVASHADPDGDALGSQLAYASYLRALGKEVFLIRDGAIPSKYAFLRGIDALPHENVYGVGFTVDTAIILECPNISRIGKGSRLLSGSVRIVNIDHHRDNDLFGEVNWINIKASSVGEMVYEFFESVDYEIEADTAEQLYTAIMTDTGRFRYRSTSCRTMEIAGLLIKAGADPQKACEEVYYNLKPSTMKLIGKVLNGIEFFEDGQICFLSLTAEMLAHTEAEMSESDGLVDYTLYNEGVKVGALFKQTGGSVTKVSLRSRDGINVAAIAARFGGGGHFNAAGCSVDLSLADAKGQILKMLSEAIREEA